MNPLADRNGTERILAHVNLLTAFDADRLRLAGEFDATVSLVRVTHASGNPCAEVVLLHGIYARLEAIDFLALEELEAFIATVSALIDHG